MSKKYSVEAKFEFGTVRVTVSLDSVFGSTQQELDAALAKLIDGFVQDRKCQWIKVSDEKEIVQIWKRGVELMTLIYHKDMLRSVPQ